MPGGATTDLHADFWINPPIRREGNAIRVDIKFVDQNGHRRTIKNVRIESDKQKTRTPIKLRQEAVYKLEHDIEKKVAALLKDEITRYKKFGRRHGELGSLHAVYKGKVGKQIYGDGWNHSQSGRRFEVVSDPQNAVIKSENGDTLIALFDSLENEAEKELFVSSLTTRLNREKEYCCVSYLILYVLFRIGKLERGLETAATCLIQQPTWIDKLLRRKPREPSLEPHQRHGLGDMLGLLNALLRYNHASFRDVELDAIEAFIEKPMEFGERIDEKIHSARSFRLNTPVQ